MQDLITVVIPLKDRSLFTRRLMTHFNNTKFPHKVILADGGIDGDSERELRSGEYEYVDYRYIRYPHDESLTQFHEKLYQCSREVDTPFVVSIDNDDFLVTGGIQNCVNFLVDNEEYSSCRGALTGFKNDCQWFPTHSDLCGSMYVDFPDDITGASAAERVIDQSKHFHSNWHNVTHSSHYRATHKILRELNPQGFRFTEQTIGFLGVVWGNGSRNEYDFILHQHGTPRVVGCERLPSQDNWISESSWPENFAKMTDAVAVGVSAVDDISIEDARTIFRINYENMYTKRVPGNLGVLSEAVKSSQSFYRQDLQGLIEDTKGLVN